MKQLIQKLTDVFSPSGYEAAIRDVIRAEIQSSADDIRVDALGNLIVHKAPTVRNGDTRKIMIAAHMDEIGVIATHIDENGFVRFGSVGGVYPRNLPGGRVRFANGVAGVIGVEPVQKAGDVQPLEKCYIDIGAGSAKKHPIRVGDVAAFERPFLDLGQRVVAKSMDDRIGCVVALEALRSISSTPHDLYFVFTTQEEVGTRGAETSAFGIDPDLGFSIDVTLCGDTPSEKGPEVNLGQGPAIKIKDGGMLSDPRIIQWMVQTAEKAGIPYQREVLLGGTTDARAMQLARSGVPVGCVSIPCRYVHTPSEMVDMRDVEQSVRLVTALLSAPVHL